jgi:hypothetical protein
VGREAEAEQATEPKPETLLEKRLRYSERRNDELRTECRRRGRNVLEQSEKNRVLERQIDSIREQLGAEILRAGQAEAELHRLAAETPGPETQGVEPWLTDSARIGRTLIWSWSDVGKGAFREGYRAAQAEARALLGGERGTDQQPPAVVAEPGKENDPSAVCICGHTRGEHIRIGGPFGQGRLLCDSCDPDSTENLACKEFEAL